MKWSAVSPEISNQGVECLSLKKLGRRTYTPTIGSVAMSVPSGDVILKVMFTVVFLPGVFSPSVNAAWLSPTGETVSNMVPEDRPRLRLLILILKSSLFW